MLNIKDIQEKWANNPIPQEILNVRAKIREITKNMIFKKEGHQYYLLENESQIPFESVTSICKKFEHETNWDEIAERKAKWEGISPEELKREWHEKNLLSTSNGTLDHLFAEACMWFYMGELEKIPNHIMKHQYEDGYLIPHGPKQEAISSFFEHIFNDDGLYPIMPEIKVYLREGTQGIQHNISGTMDALFGRVREGRLSLMIVDWKTNKSLTNEYNQSHNIHLLSPDLDYLVEEPLSLYTLQLSLYAMGIREMGYEVDSHYIIWAKTNGTYEIIPTRDVSKDLVSSLSWM